MCFDVRKLKQVVIIPFHFKSVLLYHSLTSKGVNVLGFWDNDINITGKNYDGKSITLPDTANSCGEPTIIVSYKGFENEINKQLIDLGHSDLISAHTLELDEIYDYINLVNENDLNLINPRYVTRQLYTMSNMYPLNSTTVESIIDAVNLAGKQYRKENARRVLLISHDLGINGAPIALQNAAKAIKDYGDLPIICCRTSGRLLPILLNDNIPVIIDYKLVESELFLQLVALCDIVIVNTFTILSFFAIEKLNGLSTPVLWWIHEGDFINSPGLLKSSPYPLRNNIHVYSVGEYARQHLMHARPDILPKVLLYGMDDLYDSRKSSHNGRIRIMTVGLICNLKGQDILCEAIRKLDNFTREKCEFIFVGKSVMSDPVSKEVFSLKNEFPSSVMTIGEVEHEKIWELLKDCDCMVCASRDDSMPTFITEAMMYHIVCICSENTGFKDLIEDGVNGFVYYNNNPDELCSKLDYVVKNSSELDNMRLKSRQIYEDHFTFSSFKVNLIEILDTISLPN